MYVWLTIAAVILVHGLFGVGAFYARYQRGEIERSDVMGALLLIGLTLVLVMLSELFAREFIGGVFFLWLPVGYLVRRRHA